ncbi:Cilia-and flagella-associated protein 52 [Chlamydomonas reinhardtii] [Rhizoctonia solani]|uniref:Cilia-and flagella-associated protein 52 [Chlamydomonas reinhardtii] n=1 Tax=Rhizoctonia solani TaxID=456999 RepID=A0A0K6G4S7_9AGAM|nr:Cilia-and flagella-associated protein 52 [Chlamydomonas reinhardtii] [Rhizoctonia solani]
MPFRKKIKQTFKQAKDDLISIFGSRDEDSTRPITPTGTALQSTPGNGFEESTIIASPSQEEGEAVIDIRGPNASSNIAMPTNPTTSKPETEQGDSDLVCDHTGPDGINTTEGQTLEQAPPMVLEAPSIKWKGLKEFAQVLDPVTNVFGPIKNTVDLFIECVDKCELKMTGEAKTEYDALRVRLEGLFIDLNGHFGEGCSPVMTSSMESLCRSIQTELSYIKRQQERNIGERYLVAADESRRVLACYRRIEGYLQRLSLNTNLSVWRVAQEHAGESRSDRMSSLIDRLPSSLPAWYNSAEGIELKRRHCTPGTRVDVLANLLGWARSGGGGMYWLNGMAGTGKTTIAYSVCAELDSNRQLGASFFCSRLREECRNVNMIIPSIAYQLARFSRPFQFALSAVLEKDPDVHGRLPHMQFDALIAKPMLEVQHTLPEGLVVVIDVLDECEQKESTGRMLDVFLSKSTNIPIKFILSSRPESQIRDQMTSERVRSRLVLHELDKGEVQADIEKYLREGLVRMNPSEAQIAALVEKAGILFIYAATAIRYIGYDNFQSDPDDRLRALLIGSQAQEDKENEEIDQLYMTILEAALGNRRLRKVEMDNMRQVLHTVICAREPLSLAGVSELLQINNIDRVRAALRPFWSVLHIVESSQLVTTLHASFPDFMFDPTRSQAYHCNLIAQNRIIAERCFESISRAQPQFNICGIESSYVLDDMVPNIEERVTKTIPLTLSYAFPVYAATSVDGSAKPDEADEDGGGMYESLEGDQELVELIHDAQRFVDTFASNPVSRSTSHIYVSMLAFWPKYAPVAKYYAQLTHKPVIAEGTALDRRQLVHLATWVFEETINSIAVSKDGRFIALGGGTNVLVVELSSGQVVLRRSHDLPDRPKSIMFSPDQTRILAVSRTETLMSATLVGWDTRTGEIVFGPLQLDGHTDLIHCIALSFDCTRILTGSRDRTIRLWDVDDGKLLRCQKTHGYAVLGVEFSSVGINITALCGLLSTEEASPIAFFPKNPHVTHAELCSTLVYVRNAQNGSVTHELNVGNISGICYVGYSPDGKYIVTGGYRAVQVWDAQNGQLLHDPLEGHPNGANTIAFLSGGSRLVSGGEDGLVCTWDARRIKLAPHSISTPSYQIHSTKFSPDGRQFVTGSGDGTLHIWDSHTGTVIAGPIKAHTDRVMYVDFLDDRVVSSSEDDTLCVYRASSGQVVLAPLKVAPDNSHICAIAFLPTRNLIATQSSSSLEINFWDVQSDARKLGSLTIKDLDDLISSAQFSPDGTRLATSFWNSGRQIIVWDVSTGKNMFGFLKGHTGDVTSISYSPNGALIASGSFDRTIIVWDAYTGSQALTPLIGHSDRIGLVNFSSDSSRLVSGSYDKTIRIWNVETGQTLLELLPGHQQAIVSVAFSPDGARILSCCQDMSVRISNARKKEENVGYSLLCLLLLNLTLLTHASYRLYQAL